MSSVYNTNTTPLHTVMDFKRNGYYVKIYLQNNLKRMEMMIDTSHSISTNSSKFNKKHSQCVLLD